MLRLLSTSECRCNRISNLSCSGLLRSLQGDFLSIFWGFFMGWWRLPDILKSCLQITFHAFAYRLRCFVMKIASVPLIIVVYISIISIVLISTQFEPFILWEGLREIILLIYVSLFYFVYVSCCLTVCDGERNSLFSWNK